MAGIWSQVDRSTSSMEKHTESSERTNLDQLSKSGLARWSAGSQVAMPNKSSKALCTILFPDRQTLGQKKCNSSSIFSCHKSFYIYMLDPVSKDNQPIQVVSHGKLQWDFTHYHMVIFMIEDTLIFSTE